MSKSLNPAPAITTYLTMLNNMPIFNFGSAQIRVQIDSETSEVWFLAKDICDVLKYANTRDAILNHVDSVDVAKRYTHQKDSTGRIQRQQQQHVNESGMYALIFGSTKPEAREFKRFVTSVILPTIRKTGEFSFARQMMISDLMLQIPREWEKTFNDEFFQLSVEMVTGLKFDRSKGTPSCIGNFINKYIYGFLDQDIVRIAKQTRDASGVYGYIHQFLDAKFGAEALKAHINVVIHLMKASSQNYDAFKSLMKILIENKKQSTLLLN